MGSRSITLNSDMRWAISGVRRMADGETIVGPIENKHQHDTGQCTYCPAFSLEEKKQMHSRAVISKAPVKANTKRFHPEITYCLDRNKAVRMHHNFLSFKT